MSLKRVKLIMLLVALLAAACESPADWRRVDKLRELAAETPLYPDFKVFAYNEGVKTKVAVINTSYTSGADFKDVKAFYMRELIPRGWELKEGGGVEQGPVSGLKFRKGPYELSINCADGRYFVSYQWGEF